MTATATTWTWTQAARSYELAGQDARYAPAAYSALGNLLVRAGQPTNARIAYEAAVAAVPTDAGADISHSVHRK